MLESSGLDEPVAAWESVNKDLTSDIVSLPESAFAVAIAMELPPHMNESSLHRENAEHYQKEVSKIRLRTPFCHHATEPVMLIGPGRVGGEGAERC